MKIKTRLALFIYLSSKIQNWLSCNVLLFWKTKNSLKKNLSLSILIDLGSFENHPTTHFKS